METQEESIIRNLKLLLMTLAAKCERPEMQLQELLREVIGELHDETQAAIRANEHPRARLRLIRGVD